MLRTMTTGQSGCEVYLSDYDRVHQMEQRQEDEVQSTSLKRDILSLVKIILGCDIIEHLLQLMTHCQFLLTDQVDPPVAKKRILYRFFKKKMSSKHSVILSYLRVLSS